MKIEKYESKVNQSGAGVSAQADSTAFTQSGRQLSEIGQTLGGIGQKMTQAQAYQEHTNAMNTAHAQMNELQLKQQADPNYKNADAYVEEMAKIRNTAGKGITLGSARRQFENDFTSLLNEKTMAVKQNARVKLVDAGAAAMQNGINQLAADYKTEGNPVKQRQILGRMNMLIEGATARGFIDNEQGVTKRQAILSKIGEEKLGYDIDSQNTVEGLERVREAAASGAYEQNGVNINAKAKRTLLGLIDNKIKKQEQEALKAVKEEINATETELGNRAVYGGKKPGVMPLSLDEINEREVLKKITPEYANILRKFKTEPKVVVSKQEKAKAVAEMAGKLFEIDSDNDETVDKDVTLKQVSDYRIAAFDRHNKGALTDTQLGKALGASELAFRNGLQETMDPSFGFAQKVWNFFVPKFMELKPKEQKEEMQAFVFDQLTDRMSQGDITADQVPQIVKTIRKNWNLKTNPRAAAYDKDDIGKVMEINGTNYRIVGFYDDGEPNVEPVTK